MDRDDMFKLFRDEEMAEEFDPSYPESLLQWMEDMPEHVTDFCETHHILGYEEELDDQDHIGLWQQYLPDTVVKELEVACEREDKTLDTVSFDRFKELLWRLYDSQQSDISVILKMFDPSRNTQECGTSMREHVLDFKINLPLCMNPTTAEEMAACVDLIKRTAFYASLNDYKVKKALMKIPEEKATYATFTKTAIAMSEGKRRRVKKAVSQPDTAMPVLKRKKQS